jgi:hypothetical protein
MFIKLIIKSKSNNTNLNDQTKHNKKKMPRLLSHLILKINFILIISTYKNNNKNEK